MDALIICLLSICAVMAVIALMTISDILYDLNKILKNGIVIKIKDGNVLYIDEIDGIQSTIEADTESEDKG